MEMKNILTSDGSTIKPSNFVALKFRDPCLIFMFVGNIVDITKQYLHTINFEILYNFCHKDLKDVHSLARTACDSG